MSSCSRACVAAALSVLLTAPPLTASSAPAIVPEHVDLFVRGQHLTVELYRPAIPVTKVKGTIIMGSGDVGWVGLAVSMAEFLSEAGYVVVGANVGQYPAAFTRPSGAHLTTKDVPQDYAALADLLRHNGLLTAPVIVSGVS